MNYNEAMEKLKKYGQEHVLKYYAELPDEQRNTLIEQIDRTDFTVIGQAAETGKRGTDYCGSNGYIQRLGCLLACRVIGDI